MGSQVQQQMGVNRPVAGTAGVLAGRNRALNTPQGQGAPTIDQLVGGVGQNIGAVNAAQAAPQFTPAPVQASVDQIMQGQGGMGPGQLNVADVIRQIRALQGMR